MRNRGRQKKTLLAIAGVAFVYGFLGLLAALAILYLLWSDGNDSVRQALSASGWNLASMHPGFLADTLLGVAEIHLLFLFLLACAYTAVHFIEAYGLWSGARWGKWFCAVDSAAYLPFELDSMMHRMTYLNVGTMIFNLLLIAYMFYLLKNKKDTNRRSFIKREF